MRRLRAVVTIAAVLCVGLVPGPDAGGAPSRSSRPQLATPQLIERAEARGDISTSTANLYLAYALAAPDKLPHAYRSRVAWDGTLTAKRLTEALETMPPGAVRSEIDALMHPVGGPGGPGTDTCLFSVSPMPVTYRSKHFYIEYNPTTLRAGLTIRDYARSLEGA